MAAARLGWIAGENNASRRRLEMKGDLMSKAAEAARDRSGKQAEEKSKELSDEEIEAAGGGINPRFLAQIFPQLNMMGSVDHSAKAFDGATVATSVATDRHPVPEQEYRLRFAALVQQVVAAQKQQKSAQPGSRAKSGEVSDNVHPRVIANAQEFWGFDVAEARAKFEAFAAVYYRFGRRATTLASRASAVKCWEWFCDTYGYTAYPASMESLIAWTVFNSTRIAVSSCRRYISSLRSHHKAEGYFMPDNKDLPFLTQVLDGLDYVKMAQDGNHARLPCTIDVVRSVLTKKLATAVELNEEGGAVSVYSLDSFRFAAAVYTFAFAGGFRPSEFTVRTNASKGYTSHPLKLKDLTLFTGQDGAPHSLIVLLPSRKTDQLGKKSDVVIGRVEDPSRLVEPIDRLLNYLEARRAQGETITEDSYLFPVKDASGKMHGLTYQELTDGMNKDLAAAGFDPSLYQGHSWRIGMATTLAMNGVPEYIIKDMGGWSRNSSAFNLYVRRCPPEQRAVFARFLAQPFDGKTVPQAQNTGLHPWRLF